MSGKETIDSFNTSETRGREFSHGLNYQKLGKELMTQGEIAVIENGHIDRDTEDSIKQRLVAVLFKFRFDGQEV